MTRAKNQNVYICIVSPEGIVYPATSLQLAAKVISFIFMQITGERTYYDYSLVRHRISYDNGEFAQSSPMHGWKLIEVKTLNDLMHVWYMSINRTTNELNNRLTKEQIIKITDQLNNQCDLQVNSYPNSYPNGQGNSALDEFNKVFNS